MILLISWCFFFVSNIDIDCVFVIFFCFFSRKDYSEKVKGIGIIVFNNMLESVLLVKKIVVYNIKILIVMFEIRLI